MSGSRINFPFTDVLNLQEVILAGKKLVSQTSISLYDHLIVKVQRTYLQTSLKAQEYANIAKQQLFVPAGNEVRRIANQLALLFTRKAPPERSVPSLSIQKAEQQLTFLNRLDMKNISTLAPHAYREHDLKNLLLASKSELFGKIASRLLLETVYGYGINTSSAPFARKDFQKLCLILHPDKTNVAARIELFKLLSGLNATAELQRQNILLDLVVTICRLTF